MKLKNSKMTKLFTGFIFLFMLEFTCGFQIHLMGNNCALSKQDEFADRSGNTNYSKGDYFFNVREYGATGDGLTDDSDAVQEAMTNAAASGHGVVYLPEGQYLLRKVIEWVRPVGNRSLNGLVVRGDGTGKTVIIVDNSEGGFKVDDFYNLTQFQFRNMTILAARPDAGTAISVGKFGNRMGARGYRCFSGENIEVRGLTPADYFDWGGALCGKPAGRMPVSYPLPPC